MGASEGRRVITRVIYLARDLRHDARADRLAPLAGPYPLAQENVDHWVESLSRYRD